VSWTRLVTLKARSSLATPATPEFTAAAALDSLGMAERLKNRSETNHARASVRFRSRALGTLTYDVFEISTFGE
jgi:hypothetical protein